MHAPIGLVGQRMLPVGIKWDQGVSFVSLSRDLYGHSPIGLVDQMMLEVGLYGNHRSCLKAYKETYICMFHWLGRPDDASGWTLWKSQVSPVSL